MDELRNLSQEIRDLIEAERVKAAREAVRVYAEAGGFFRRKWWLGWALFAFVASCSVLWAVTR